MIKFTLLLGVMWVVMTLLSRAAIADEPSGNSPVKDAGQGAFMFAYSLYQEQAGLGKDSPNLVFSPTSIRLAVAMVGEGARGETAKQIQHALGQDAATTKPSEANRDLLLNLAMGGPRGEQDSRNKFELAISNGLWLQKGLTINPAFVGVLKSDYSVDLVPLDFATDSAGATRTINDAVAKQTHDKIKDLLAPGLVGKTTRLVLTNAVYLKAAWAEPFKTEATKDQAFHTADDKSVNVPTMHQTANLQYFEDGNLKVLELPYEGRELSMFCILTKDREPTSFVKTEEMLFHLSDWIKGLKPRFVTVALPKFKFESQLDLTADLKQMGIKDAFTDAADFSGITTQEKLAIGVAVHKAYIDVNEAGTEAAAATALTMRTLAMRKHPEKAEFIADRPFLFAIRHNQSGEILFLGRVVKP